MLPTSDMSSSQLERKLVPSTRRRSLLAEHDWLGDFIAPSLMAKTSRLQGCTSGCGCSLGLFTLLGAFSYAELAAMMPEAGGQYVYLRRAFGPLPGFCTAGRCFGDPVRFYRGGGDCFCEVPGNFLSVGREEKCGFRCIKEATAPSVFRQPKRVALLVIAVLTYINTRGVVAGAAVQNLFTGLKLLGLWGLLALILILGKGSTDHFAPLWSTDAAVPGAVQAGFWPRLVWLPRKRCFVTTRGTRSAFAAAEVRDPARNLPKALILEPL